jgi:hypothetical protein
MSRIAAGYAGMSLINDDELLSASQELIPPLR